ncbi:uncharacterized protein BP5553_02050 [Venustampulla echinocandica]|uniref:Uncharacterized protein n=1 Tax=Venustampulla echinocandica TaxID=2656787 RepID=A0A370U2S7_9HELO|nr:uncharacterized protein BP5553_02050 [Venustampulla echinocandica]RDL42071.1 hypothetical protein BP5553_02050 [Venustampulla echinocandica]
MLEHVPPLPKELCGKRDITGNALWSVPSPELPIPRCSTLENDDEPWDPERVAGVRKTFHLRIPKHTICTISAQSDFGYTFSDCQSSSPNGLAILTLCWSYIFSVRPLELQHRRMQYSLIKTPTATGPDRQQQKGVIVYLGYSSKKLVRWLCAILAPGAGWFAEGSVPPWAAHYSQDVEFFIGTDYLAEDIIQESPPSSAEAADLLVEFCELYDFGFQPSIAFLAALLLPFHNAQGLQPRLPMPRIPRYTKPSHGSPVYI